MGCITLLAKRKWKKRITQLRKSLVNMALNSYCQIYYKDFDCDNHQKTMQCNKWMVIIKPTKIMLTQTTFKHLHSVSYFYAVLPFYDVECLRSGGREWGREATPTSISIFDFYGIKALWFEFANDIFTGFKTPRL